MCHVVIKYEAGHEIYNFGGYAVCDVKTVLKKIY